MNLAEFIEQYNSNNYPPPKEEDKKIKVLDVAYSVYLNALNNKNNFCIFGRRNEIANILGSIPKNVNLNKRPENNEKILLTIGSETVGLYMTSPIKNIEITNEYQTGNVLYSGNWTIGVNDAWVLGGIHSNSTFNFVYDVNNFNNKVNEYKKNNKTQGISEGDIKLEVFIREFILINNSKYPTTVTARELLGLKIADYKAVLEYDTLVLSPTRKGAEPSWNLRWYNNNIKNYSSKKDTVQQIKELLRGVFK